MQSELQSQGVVYISVGAGVEGELRRAVASLRMHEPEMPVTILWAMHRPNLNNLTKGLLLQEAPHFNGTNSWRQLHRLIKAWAYDNLPYDQTLFLDSDTLVVGKLDGAFTGSDQAVCGIPDGHFQTINLMGRWSFYNFPQFAEQVFSHEFVEASRTMIAWNVGVLPLGRRMASKFSEHFLDLTKFLAFGMPKSLYASYSKTFDEQVPLAFSLWKNGVPTGNLGFEWNLTKTRIGSFQGKPKVIHCRLKTEACRRLVERFVDLDKLEAMV